MDAFRIGSVKAYWALVQLRVGTSKVFKLAISRQVVLYPSRMAQDLLLRAPLCWSE